MTYKTEVTMSISLTSIFIILFFTFLQIVIKLLCRLSSKSLDSPEIPNEIRYTSKACPKDLTKCHASQLPRWYSNCKNTKHPLTSSTVLSLIVEEGRSEKPGKLDDFCFQPKCLSSTAGRPPPERRGHSKRPI